MKPKYYQPSGEYSSSVWVGFAGYALFVVPCLAALYAFLQVFFGELGANGTFHATNPALAIGGSFFLAWLARRFLVERYHVRHVALASGLVLVLALEFLYVQWAWWIVFYGTNGGLSDAMALLRRPGELGEHIAQLNTTGTWSYTDHKGAAQGRHRGSLLWLFWALEALFLTIVPMLGGRKRAGDPYCEKTRSWFKRIALPTLSSPTGAWEMAEQLLQGQEDDLAKAELSELLLADDKDSAAQNAVKTEKATQALKNNFKLVLYYLEGESSFVTINAEYYGDGGKTLYEDRLVRIQVSDTTSAAILALRSSSQASR